MRPSATRINRTGVPHSMSSLRSAKIASRPAADWVALGASIGVPLTVVNDASHALDDPRVAEATARERRTCGAATFRTHGPVLLKDIPRRLLPDAPSLGDSNGESNRKSRGLLRSWTWSLWTAVKRTP